MYKFLCAVITIGFLSLAMAQGPYTLSYNLSQFEFSFENGYDRIKGTEMSAITDTGAPELPIKSLNFILPNGTKVQNVEILSLSLVPVAGTYNIYPTQPQVPMSAPRPPWVEPDSLIYSKDELYPDSMPIKVTHRGGFSGIPMVTITAYPLLYNPVRDSLYLVQSVTFRFTLESVPLSRRPQIMGERIFQLCKDAIKSSVYNYWEVDAFYTPPPLIPDEQLLSKGGMEVVIITTSAMAGAYQPLAQWLVEKGMPTMIVTLDWIYAMYDGYWTYADYAGWSEEHIGDDAAKVKEFLYDAHWQHGLAFAILGGSDDAEFPFRFCWGIDNLPLIYSDYIPPADLYFQVFYGEWDRDGDLKIGEPNDDDPGYIPNIFIGRVPAWNYDQALSWVEKRLTYEKAPANRNLMTHSFWICQENYDFPFRTYMEVTKQRFPNYFTQHQLVDFLCDPVHHELIDTLSIGYGIASHYGHGAPDGLRTNSYAYGNPYKELLLSWEYGNFPSVDELYNVNKYYIFYSFGCITAAFDSFAESDWNGHWNGNIYPCVPEGFVSFYRLDVPPDQRPAIGAVAYIGNTRHIGPGPSLAMHQEFLRNLFDTPIGYIIGISHAVSKYSSYFVGWVNAYMNNLFGSPEMPVWTINPKDMTVYHPDAIPFNTPVSFEVTVYEDPAGIQPIPLLNALVTLYKSGEIYPEIYQSQITNAEGKAYFDITVPTIGIMKVTVTKHNFIPYQDNVQVLEFVVDIPTTHTAYSEGRKLVRTPNTENLHLSYTWVDVIGGVNGPDDWSAYSISTDGGTSWTETQNIHRFARNPSIGLTTELFPRPCLACRNSPEPYQLDQPAEIYFARFDTPDWQIFTIDSYPCIPGTWYPKISPPSMRIDANNIVHLVYSGVLYLPDKAYVIYKRFDAFDPATETVIIDSATVPEDWEPSSPCIDLQYGYPHIVYDFPPEAGEPEPEIWYRCLTETGWSNKVNISNSYTLPSEHPFIYLTNEKTVVAWSEEEEVGNEESREIWKGERFLNHPPEDWTTWREVETPNQASDWPIITARDRVLVWCEHQYIEGSKNWEVLYHSDLYGDGNLSNTPYTQSLYASCDWRQTLTGVYLYTTYTEKYESEANPYIFGIKAKRNFFLPVAIPMFTIYAGSEIPSPYLIQRDGYISYENYPVDYDTNELVYKFIGLNPDLKYRLDATAYHESNGEWREKVRIDNTVQHLIKYEAGIPKTVELPVPPAVYKHDGEIIVRITKISGEFAMLHLGNLYEFEKEGGGGPQSSTSGIILPIVFGLSQSYPNPFHFQTIINYQLPGETNVNLKIYNVAGQLIRTLVNEKQPPGYYTVRWDGRDETGEKASSGIYFLILEGEKETRTQKVLVVR